MIDSSLETIVDWGDCKDKHPRWNEDAVEDYMQLKSNVEMIAKLINESAFSPIIGTGNPNGAIVSNYSLQYIDSSVPTLYYNPVFGANTGWIAI